jgi:hypothetical protein
MRVRLQVQAVDHPNDAEFSARWGRQFLSATALPIARAKSNETCAALNAHRHPGSAAWKAGQHQKQKTPVAFDDLGFFGGG